MYLAVNDGYCRKHYHIYCFELLVPIKQINSTEIVYNKYTVFYHFIIVEILVLFCRDLQQNGRKEGNVLFNDAINTFYLRLYGVGYMVKDHSDSERGNPLPPHGLPFPISNKASFICIIPETG